MTELDVPAGLAWELILVDNNSTDETLEVAARFSERLPLRVVLEARQGLSHARNAALREAAGRHIIWTDDDVLVDGAWLRAYVAAFQAYPDATMFGGPVLPWFEGEAPAWLRSTFTDVAEAFAVRDLRCGDVPISDQVMPFGANMAFATRVLGPNSFDPELGRSGNKMLGGEETSVVRRLLARGDSGRWVPDAVVHHFLPRIRQTTRYLEAWYAGYGATMALLDDDCRTTPTFLGRPRWLWREFFASNIRYYVSRRARRPGVWIRDLKRAGIARGQFLAALELRERH